jgi:hypothetical protein
VDPRAGLEAVAKEKSRGLPARNPVTVLSELPELLFVRCDEAAKIQQR